ncbi:hypothetical protein [Kribbella sindirgiensis]|uniref:hypothetical protein n=1 Tax=Kribbella sindirgiensis TaxID=1124744 RepID=UPI00307B12D8
MAVGQAINRAGAGRRIRTQLELGGKNALIMPAEPPRSGPADPRRRCPTPQLRAATFAPQARPQPNLTLRQPSPNRFGEAPASDRGAPLPDPGRHDSPNRFGGPKGRASARQCVCTDHLRA